VGGGTKMKIFINFLLTILNLCVIKKYKRGIYEAKYLYSTYEGENVRAFLKGKILVLKNLTEVRKEYKNDL
jgi:hypothetical protein